MSIVWVIERQKPDAAFHALIGDFAVRAFASLASFGWLLRIARKSPPAVVVIDLEDSGVEAKEALGTIDRAFPGVPVILIADAGGELVAVENVFRFPKPVDPLALVPLVSLVLKGEKNRRSVIRYRDVLLDYERFQCVVMPGDEAQDLPRKEAQLLKLFLERPEACLTREEIRDAVWRGTKIGPRTIDSHVSRLRSRLRDTEVSIESVYGGGYVLKPRCE